MNADGKAVPSFDKRIILSCVKGLWSASYEDSLEKPVTMIDLRRAERALTSSYRLHKVDLYKRNAKVKEHKNVRV